MMGLYRLSIVLHILSASVWLGHMFFWSVIVGPVTKRIHPPQTGQQLRQLSLRFGGLGWPALFVLFITGIVMLHHHGVTWQQFFSGELFLSPFGRALGIKLLLVTCMVLYQLFIGHRPAPRLIYLNMLVALAILWVSVLLVRAPGLLI
jgi:copper resistance protein D